MFESRTQRMQLILKLAQRQEDASAQQFSEYLLQLKNEEAQLAQLNEYAEHYLQVYAGRKQGVRAQEMINYSTFIHKLGDACQEQQLKLFKMHKHLEVLKKKWQEKHQKRQSIEDLIARLLESENLLLEKQLQKELDELSSQSYHYKSYR